MMTISHKKIVFLVVLLVSLVLPLSALSCVGKTLVVGSTGGAQQDVLANMLAQLITERTGTSVKLVNHEGSESAHQALLKDDLDIYVEYTGVGLVKILGAEPITDPQVLYQAVKKRYNEELNIVWLNPLGFEAITEGMATPTQAVPIARKDTLKKFPALARLINKLSGMLDAETIALLEAQTASRGVKEVARTFLKQNRLI